MNLQNWNTVYVDKLGQEFEYWKQTPEFLKNSRRRFRRVFSTAATDLTGFSRAEFFNGGGDGLTEKNRKNKSHTACAQFSAFWVWLFSRFAFFIKYQSVLSDFKLRKGEQTGWGKKLMKFTRQLESRTKSKFTGLILHRNPGIAGIAEIPVKPLS